jgi:hypothetical protein
MSPNSLGKLLVLVPLAASMFFMTFAGAVFLQQVDWGWKEPRKDITGTKRIPSEIDQRTAAVKEAHQAVAVVLPGMKQAQADLAEIEPRFPANHQWYVQQIDRLKNDPADKIDIRDFVFDKKGGMPVLNPIVSGRPKMGNPMAGISKSYRKYEADLKDLQTKIDMAVVEIKDLIGKEEDLTFTLNGKDNTGKLVKEGLYSLLEREADNQNKAKFEKEYLLPRWVGALEEIELFQVRRQRLDANIDRLKKARGAK